MIDALLVQKVRPAETAVIAQLMAGAEAGDGGGLTLVGAPGEGRTTLLRSASAAARGWTVLAAPGHSDERDLPYAGLSGLVTPLRELIAELAPAQRAALVRGLGGEAGPGDRLTLGLALSTLWGTAGARRPVLCLIDDAHLLDPQTWQAVVFAARRLAGTRVAVLATAPTGRDPGGLPAGVLEPLGPSASRRMLAERAPDLTAEVAEAVAAMAGGSPGALTDLAGALTPEQRRGYAPLPDALPATSALRRRYRAEVAVMPARTRRLLLLAACPPRAATADLLAAAALLDTAAPEPPVASPAVCPGHAAGGAAAAQAGVAAAAPAGPAAPAQRRVAAPAQAGVAAAAQRRVAAPAQAGAEAAAPAGPATPVQTGPAAPAAPGAPEAAQAGATAPAQARAAAPAPAARSWTPDSPAGQDQLAAFAPAERAGLVQVDGAEVRFRSEAVRGCVYADAPASRRRAAHAALAQVLTARAAGSRNASGTAGPPTARDNPKPGTAPGHIGPLTTRNTAEPVTTRSDARPAPARDATGPPAARDDTKPGTAHDTAAPSTTHRDTEPCTARDTARPSTAPGGTRAGFRPEASGRVFRTTQAERDLFRSAGQHGGRSRDARGATLPQVECLPALLHRAAATVGPDPVLAARLVRAARAAEPAVAAEAHRYAAGLCADPASRGAALLDAARATWLAGRPHDAGLLVRRIPPAAAPAQVRARGLAAAIRLPEGRPGARELLLDVAADLADSDTDAALEALALAGEAAVAPGEQGRYAGLARRVGARQRGDEPPATTLAFHHVAGLARLADGDEPAAFARFRRALDLADRVTEPGLLIRAATAGILVGDAGRAGALAGRAAELAGGSGARVLVPQALEVAALAGLAAGDYPAANLAALDGTALARGTGQPVLAGAHLAVLAVLAALVGDRDTALSRIEACGGGPARSLCEWALALLDLVDGRATTAAERLIGVVTAPPGYGSALLRVAVVPHLLEAAAQDTGTFGLDAVATGFDRWAGRTGQPAWLALRDRCRALRARDTEAAEGHFAEALRHIGEAGFPRAHTELLFGRMLRRRRRHVEARTHLRRAAETFRLLDAGPWAEQSVRELRAAGERVDQPATVPDGPALTAQQERIAVLVAGGATNREVAQELHLSPRTVDHHLRNVFARLGVRSRTEMARLLNTR